MLKEYHNEETNTLTIPFYYNEELKELSPDTKIIIFKENYQAREYSKFNKKVDNLPRAR